MEHTLPGQPSVKLEAPPIATRKVKKKGVKGAAAMFGVCTKTIRRWLASGYITGQRVGPRGHFTFTEDYLREFAAGKAEKQRGEATN
jgi:hypothetical protein